MKPNPNLQVIIPSVHLALSPTSTKTPPIYKSVGIYMRSIDHPFQLLGEEIAYEHHSSPMSTPTLELHGVLPFSSSCVLRIKPKTLSLQRLGTTNSVQIMKRPKFVFNLPILIIYTYSRKIFSISISFSTLKIGILA